MTKHAVQSFTECMFLELQVKEAQISVSSVTPDMLKPSIFEAGAGEWEGAGGKAYRKAMFEMMSNYGMDVDEECMIIRGIASKKFRVDTQPDMTDSAVQHTVEFLAERRDR
jgi:short-subunit dehydrogenase